MRLSIIAPLVIVAIIVGIVGCGDDEQAADSGKINVITTLPLFADFAREIGGDRVEVTSLVPLGADAHTWEPTPGDVQRVADADIAFANGLDLEPAAINVIEPNLGGPPHSCCLGRRPRRREPRLLSCPKGSRKRGRKVPAQARSGEDPHLWMDPANAELYAGIIRDALVEADPDGKSIYDQNYDNYLSEIRDVYTYVAEKTTEIPETNRKLVTTHDAFGYFSRAFGLSIVAFVAPSPGQETSPEDIANLSKAMKDQGVPAVFVEPQIGTESEILRQAGDDAGVQVCELYSDSLDDRITTYIKLMRFNADELARCLG